MGNNVRRDDATEQHLARILGYLCSDMKHLRDLHDNDTLHLSDLKIRVGDVRSAHRSICFVSDGSEEARWIADTENACPRCGGSGHKDDCAAQPAEAGRVPYMGQTMAECDCSTPEVCEPAGRCAALTPAPAAQEAKPVARTYVDGQASVAVCPICDIAGCRHIRAENATRVTPPAAPVKGAVTVEDNTELMKRLAGLRITGAMSDFNEDRGVGANKLIEAALRALAGGRE